MTYGADVSGPDTAERDPSNASGDKEIVSTNPNNIGGMTGQWEMHIRDGCPVLPPPSPPPPPREPYQGEEREGGEVRATWLTQEARTVLEETSQTADGAIPAEPTS